MTNHEFTLVLDREPDDDGFDALFEAGCDDGSVEIRTGDALVHFDRDALSLAKALVTAIQDCENAGFRVEGVQTDDPAPPQVEIGATDRIIRARNTLRDNDNRMELSRLLTA